jgi:hypothetical protein
MLFTTHLTGGVLTIAKYPAVAQVCKQYLSQPATTIPENGCSAHTDYSSILLLEHAEILLFSKHELSPIDSTECMVCHPVNIIC